MTDTSARSVFVSANDGTRLFAADNGPVDSGLVPLLCLPGLTRNSRDFDPIVTQFAGKRRVIAMDFRGRGRSAHAADPKTYRPDVELEDVIMLLDHLAVPRVAVLGTSRGGIVGMLMAAMQPARLAGLCLNDVGLHLEKEGLLRIRGYLGIDFRHPSWADAALAFARTTYGFSGVTLEQWEAAARRAFTETGSGIGPDYDLSLSETFPSTEAIRSGNVPDVRALAPALTHMPTALLRGAGSDLLSRTTLDEMRSLIPELVATEISDRGHVPFLDEAHSIEAIAQWLARVDSAH